MPALEATLERRRGGGGDGALDIEDSAVGADDALGSGMGVGVALETAEDALRPGRLVVVLFAIFGGVGGAIRGGVVVLECLLSGAFHGGFEGEEEEEEVKKKKRKKKEREREQG
jgi:hypothetical protein